MSPHNAGQHFLQFLVTLLGHGQVPAPAPQPLELAVICSSAQRQQWCQCLQRLLPCAVLGYICRHGGAVPTPVVIDQQRHYGRVWEVPASSALRITPHGLQWLIAIYNAASQSSLPPALEHGGDMLLAHLALRPYLQTAPPAPQWLEYLARNPLSQLFYPQYYPGTASAGNTAKLCHAPLDLLLSYLALPIVEQWLAWEACKLRQPSQQLVKLNEQTHQFLEDYIQNVHRHQTLALLKLPLLFFQRWCQAEDLQERIIAKAQGLPTVAAREALLHSYGQLCRLGTKMNDLATALRQQPFVQRQVHEHLFLEHYQHLLAPLHAKLSHLRRRWLKEL